MEEHSCFVLSNEINYNTYSAELCYCLALVHLSLGLDLVSVARHPALNPPDAVYLKENHSACISKWMARQRRIFHFFYGTWKKKFPVLQIHLNYIMFHFARC